MYEGQEWSILDFPRWVDLVHKVIAVGLLVLGKNLYSFIKDFRFPVYTSEVLKNSQNNYLGARWGVHKKF
jgi:hypothetical protein